MSSVDLPDAAEVRSTIKLIDDHAPSIFMWSYEREREQLVTLYNKAKASQWNSVTELDWATDVDPEAARRGRHARSCGSSGPRPTCPGSPLASWAEQGVHASSAIESSRPASASSCTASRAR